MSDPREALVDLLSEHRFLWHSSHEGDVCYCGWSDHDQPHGEHQAELIAREFLVVPRSDITGTEYAIEQRDAYGRLSRYNANDEGHALRSAQALKAELPTTRAVSRPVLAWSPLSGEVPDAP